MGVYIILSLFIEAALAIILAGVFISVYFARKSGAPYFPTPQNAIRTALKEASLAAGETFYDLGAGDGKALVIAENEFGARATGFEISRIIWLLGKINLFLRGSRAKLIAKNFFDADLRDADVVFCFLAIRTMQKMEDKLRAELKPGARVIVYAFPLPDMMPVKTIVVHGEWKMFFYYFPPL